MISKIELKKVWPALFSVVVLAGLAVYLYLNAERFRQLLNVSLGSLVLLSGLVLVSISVKGFVNYLFYREMGASFMGLNESIGLAVINTVSNQLPFAGGMIAKGVYLKRKYKVAYTRYVSATVALYVCYLASTGIVGLSTLLYRAFRGNDVPWPLVLGFCGMVASVVVLWLPLDMAFLPDKWKRRTVQLAAGWQLFQQSRLLLLQLVGLQIVLTALAAGRLWIAFHLLSQDVQFSHCLLFSSSSILTRLVSISPGGLGVREAIIASVASILGFDMGVSAVAVGLERLISTLINIILGVFYSYILGNKVAAAPEIENCEP